jgi:hypothetical protein
MAPSFGVNAKFEVRSDVYNFFNKLNIKPNSIDGLLGSVNPEGTLNGVPNADFGVAGSVLGSRTIQLQARFSRVSSYKPPGAGGSSQLSEIAA